jgi:hypothetical protein
MAHQEGNLHSGQGIPKRSKQTGRKVQDEAHGVGKTERVVARWWVKRTLAHRQAPPARWWAKHTLATEGLERVTERLSGAPL